MTLKLSMQCATLGNPDRLALLKILARTDRGLTIRQILSEAGYAAASLQTVRRHLASLVEAGFATRESVGRCDLYRVNPDGLERFRENFKVEALANVAEK